MDNKINSKIKELIISIVFIALFLVSLFVLLNNRLGFMNNIIKPIVKTEKSIEVINDSTKWYYLKEGKNPGVGNVWATDNYDASSWEKGYGDFVGGEDGNIPSYFFRYEFNMEEETLEIINGIEGIVQYEDAVIIYLNGIIIFAGNVPAGGYDSNLDTGASEIIEGKQIKSFEVTDLSSLKQGKNIIGVELHRANNESKDIYFNFEKLQLSTKEFKKTLYNIDGLILKNGDIDNEIYVNWMTELSDFFKIEYIEANKYKNAEDFFEHGESVLMGRKKLDNSNLYLNNVQIKRLKDDTKYIYRIFKIGSTEVSKSYSFKTAKRKGFSFIYLKTPHVLNESFYKLFSNWNGLLKNHSSVIESADFIIASMNQDYKLKTKTKTQQVFMMLRKPEILKKIPVITTLIDDEKNEYVRGLYKSQFNRKTENKQGNYYIVYQDSLIIHLNSNDDDYKLHKQFIQDAIDKTKRKWVIVVTHNIHINKEILDICDELSIDLVLDDEEYITKVSVDNDELLIEEYRLDSATKIKEYILVK